MKLHKLLFAYFLVLLFAPILILAPYTASARGFPHNLTMGHSKPYNPPPVSNPPVTLPTGFQWGAFTGNSSVVGTWKGVFIGDGDSFTEDFGQYKSSLVVYWESNLTASQIQNGAADSYLKQWAAQMKAYPNQIIFAPLDEMNGNWNPYYGNPTAFKAAWIRIHGLFSGVGNVKFAYDPNVCGPGIPCSTLSGYFPGSPYVDLVGLDGFDFGGQTFAQVFAASIPAMQAMGKPLWILSTGAVNTDNQAKFISDIVAGAKQYGISGVIYFDYQQFSIPASTLQNL